MANTRAVSVSADGAVTAPAKSLYGWSFAENAGTPAAAHVRIYDNTAGSGTILASIKFAASGSSSQSFASGIDVINGSVYVDVVTGSVEGSVYVGF